MPTILIVEDEFAIAELLKEVLTDAGYRVLIASNGRQGLDRLAQGAHPDLLICDFMMPVMDGGRLLRAMHDKEEYRDIPFIMMSSLPEGNVRESAKGYRAFIRKPFPLRTLVELIGATIARTPRSGG
jgi:CheY-like chemotaxis protein